MFFHAMSDTGNSSTCLCELVVLLFFFVLEDAGVYENARVLCCFDLFI